MELIKYTTEWVEGEVLQGKIMLAMGLVLLIGIISILRSDHELLRGSLIPLSLILLALIGYGGFQTFARPGHIAKVQALYDANPQEALDTEYSKAQKDDKIYTRLKYAWAVLIVISLVMYFVFTSDYYKGLALGTTALFLSSLVLDSVLHHRLIPYLKGLAELANA